MNPSAKKHIRSCWHPVPIWVPILVPFHPSRPMDSCNIGHITLKYFSVLLNTNMMYQETQKNVPQDKIQFLYNKQIFYQNFRIHSRRSFQLSLKISSKYFHHFKNYSFYNQFRFSFGSVWFSLDFKKTLFITKPGASIQRLRNHYHFSQMII